MPSVDGVGRYFPLSICCCEAEPDTYLVAPPDADLNAWYLECERTLLSMLEDSLPDEPGPLVALLADAPSTRVNPAAMQEVDPGIRVSQDAGIDAAFALLGVLDTRRIHAQRGYWWTSGGGAHGEKLVATEGSIGSALFNKMISGVFSSAHTR